MVARASALSNRSNCVTITSGVRDELGLLPAKEACRPVPVDGTSAAVPLPSVPALPAVTAPNAIVPPNLLLHPPSVNSVPVPAQNGSNSRAELPTTRGTGDVLPNPTGAGSERLRPEPWRPCPAHDSPRPAAPLPPWILQPRLLPPG